MNSSGQATNKSQIETNRDEQISGFLRVAPNFLQLKGITLAKATQDLVMLRSACSEHHLCPCVLSSECRKLYGVPLATESGISSIILPLMRILQRKLNFVEDTFLFISHTTNVILFKFHCNIFNGVRIIKEMPGSVASGTPCIKITVYSRI